MGARTLQARLTARLLAIAGVVSATLGVSAVVVTDRVLDAADTSAARADAAGVRDALARERSEGDAWEEALSEAATSAEARGVRVTVRVRGTVVRGDALRGALAADACATYEDADRPWRACSVGDDSILVVASVPIAAHRAVVSALARSMAIVVLAAIALLFVAVRRALRGPLLELEALVSWTKQMLENRHADDPPPASTVEVAQIGAAFDVLVRRLFEALERERANSAHIAHELRTPLASMMGEIDALHVPDSPSAHAALARLRADAARLSDAIDAILLLSDDSRARAPGDSIVNVADLVRDLVRELAPSATRVEAPDEALALADDRLVALALRNLFDNARKHAGGDPRVVRVSRDGDAVRIAVVDEGPGLDDGARAHMFDRYWRKTADGDGRGLGLALVRAVAERHGGRAEARAGEGGRGLEVSMTIGRVIEWNEAAAR